MQRHGLLPPQPRSSASGDWRVPLIVDGRRAGSGDATSRDPAAISDGGRPSGPIQRRQRLPAILPGRSATGVDQPKLGQRTTLRCSATTGSWTGGIIQARPAASSECAADGLRSQAVEACRRPERQAAPVDVVAVSAGFSSDRHDQRNDLVLGLSVGDIDGAGGCLLASEKSGMRHSAE